jgi:hypothetical protein
MAIFLGWVAFSMIENLSSESNVYTSMKRTMCASQGTESLRFTQLGEILMKSVLTLRREHLARRYPLLYLLTS